eukprot:15436-Heterococcus_DN1.PRE.4
MHESNIQQHKPLAMYNLMYILVVSLYRHWCTSTERKQAWYLIEGVFQVLQKYINIKYCTVDNSNNSNDSNNSTNINSRDEVGSHTFHTFFPMAV